MFVTKKDGGRGGGGRVGEGGRRGGGETPHTQIIPTIPNVTYCTPPPFPEEGRSILYIKAEIKSDFCEQMFVFFCIFVKNPGAVIWMDT